MSDSPLLFAACDTPYFLQHGRAFCKSVHKSGNKALVVVFPNMTMDAQLQMEALASELALDNSFLASVSIKHLDITDYLSIFNTLDVKEDRAFYASMRFLLLPRIYTQGNILTVDIDSLVNDKVPAIDEKYEFGLFLRENNNEAGTEYERAGMRVAAGIVYTTPRATDFVITTAKFFESNPIKWFVDQHALYNAYSQLTDREIFKFDNQVLDWEFGKGTTIWTGKGARKYEDPTYVAAKKAIEKE